MADEPDEIADELGYLLTLDAKAEADDVRSQMENIVWERHPGSTVETDVVPVSHNVIAVPNGGQGRLSDYPDRKDHGRNRLQFRVTKRTLNNLRTDVGRPLPWPEVVTGGNLIPAGESSALRSLAAPRSA